MVWPCVEEEGWSCIEKGVRLRMKSTWTKQVEEESVKVGMSTKGAICI